MARRLSLLKCMVVIAVTYSFTVTVLFILSDPVTAPCVQKQDDLHQPNTGQRHAADSDSQSNARASYMGENENAMLKDTDNEVMMFKGDNPEWGGHKLAVIVPYRDRLEELLEFAPHLHNFLVKKKVRHKILVVNQIDIYRFNRGSLINVGALESLDCDYIAMHDVDLLPLNDMLDYSYPEAGPLHIAAPDLHPLYHYPTFIGGILLITKTQFAKVNGLSNRYYGWGREDDELYVRLKQAGLLKSYTVEKDGKEELKYEIRRPKNITTGLNTFRHIHERKKRPRDNARYFGQKDKTSKLDRETGVMSVKYELVRKHKLVINSAPVTMLEVKIVCDFIKTPWCLKKEDHYLLNEVAVPPQPDMKSP